MSLPISQGQNSSTTNDYSIPAECDGNAVGNHVAQQVIVASPVSDISTPQSETSFMTLPVALQVNPRSDISESISNSVNHSNSNSSSKHKIKKKKGVIETV